MTSTKNFASFFSKILTLERRLELTESSRLVSQEKFLDDLRDVVSDSEMSEKFVALENELAEIEEEKGNLQLKLVEYEDAAGWLLIISYSNEMSSSILRARASTLEWAVVKNEIFNFAIYTDLA